MGLHVTEDKRGIGALAGQAGADAGRDGVAQRDINADRGSALLGRRYERQCRQTKRNQPRQPSHYTPPDTKSRSISSTARWTSGFWLSKVTASTASLGSTRMVSRPRCSRVSGVASPTAKKTTTWNRRPST